MQISAEVPKVLHTDGTGASVPHRVLFLFFPGNSFLNEGGGAQHSRGQGVWARKQALPCPSSYFKPPSLSLHLWKMGCDSCPCLNGFLASL